MKFRFPALAALALTGLLASAQQQPAAMAAAPAQQQTPAAANTQQPQATEKAKPAEDPDNLHINSVTTLAGAKEVLAKAEKLYPGDDKRRLAMAMAVVVEFETAEGNTTDETVALADRAMRVAENAEGKESSIYAITLAVRARVYGALDHPELGRPMAEEAFAIENRVPHDLGDYVTVAAALNSVCQVQSDHSCQEKTLQGQLGAIHADPSNGHRFLLLTLVNLISSHNVRGEAEQARPYVEELETLAAKEETTNYNWSAAEYALSQYYGEASDYAKAYEHAKRDVEMGAALHGPDSQLDSTDISHLGWIEMALGHSEDAQKTYQRVIGMYLTRWGPDHSRTADVKNVYAQVLEEAGRHKEALDMALESHRIKREYVRLAIRLMPERQALALADTHSPSFNTLVSIGVNNPDMGGSTIYQEVVRSRALVAEEMAQRAAGLHRAHDPSVATLEDELEKRRMTVMKLQGGAPGSKLDALPDAIDSMEKTERDLAMQSARFRADERARRSDLADLRAQMPAGSVLVSFVSFAWRRPEPGSFALSPKFSYAAFAMRKDSERIRVYNLGRAAPIDDLVKALRASADAEAHSSGLGSTRNERVYRQSGDLLRKAIWDPLRPALLGAKLAFVVPDGMLNLIPFAALPEGEGYLVDHGPVIAMLSSERDLIPAGTAPKKAGLLAIGSPEFEQAALGTASPTLRGAQVDCEAFNEIQFGPLPASLGEVRDVATTWKKWNQREPTDLLTGSEATRERFLEAAPTARVLHVATHAFVLDKACGKGNPLLHSGLVFAGANRDRQASVLTAQQIASLDLEGVDWAVLSACSTGNGELHDGEGVLGLVRSFRVAGAKTVVMTLWPVDDAIARRFMRSLYAERFARQRTSADAAWLATRSLLAERRAAGKSTHPWYWAGFVASGAWQ
ncbi:MAG: CHAT domain-containing tetratricopeptide repeat protein [Terracidiphilus sp.]